MPQSSMMAAARSAPSEPSQAKTTSPSARRRATSTGTRARSTTSADTEPSSIDSSVPWPRLPTTMRSADTSAAMAPMTSAARPLAADVSTARPGTASRAAASARCVSASARNELVEARRIDRRDGWPRTAEDRHARRHRLDHVDGAVHRASRWSRRGRWRPRHTPIHRSPRGSSCRSLLCGAAQARCDPQARAIKAGSGAARASDRLPGPRRPRPAPPPTPVGRLAPRMRGCRR